MKRFLPVLMLALLMPAIPAQSQDMTTVVAGTSSYKVEFLGVSADGLTWTYRVSELTGRSLSHFVFEICRGEVTAFSPDATDPWIMAVSVGTDPATGVTGIKWDLEDNYDGVGGTNDDVREFSFTLDTVLPIGPIAVGVKTGGADNTGVATINGPSCDECLLLDPPSYDGQVIREGDDRFIKINAPAGLKMLRFYAGKNLIVEALWDSPTGGPIAGYSLSTDPALCPAFPNDGCFKFNWEGPGDPPTMVFPKLDHEDPQNTKVSFYLRATDCCDNVVDLDPVLALGEVPTSLNLMQNFPNPFNPETRIAFELPEASVVELAVFDILGREVRTLANDNFEAGVYEFVWDGRDSAGNHVASGIYLYRLDAGSVSQTRQMIMLK